jgi:hypothetical protein
MMASRFRIIRQDDSDNLHLNLIGDFDGSAAMELVAVIRENMTLFDRIFVHISGLSALLPFGGTALSRNIRSSWLRSQQLLFTGDYGRILHDDCLDKISTSVIQ